MSKIIFLKQLDSVKKGGKKIVLVGGCFDIFHIGHLKFLKTAKKNNDLLIVLLESDATVRRLKGEQRPINNQRERAGVLAALDLIDTVILLPELKTDQEYSTLIAKIRPAVIAVTEGDPILEKKRDQAEMIGAKFLIIPKAKTKSTSQLIKTLGIE